MLFLEESSQTVLTSSAIIEILTSQVTINKFLRRI